MRTYEVTFIVDPVLSNDEIKATSENYAEHLKSQNCKVVDIEDMGLKQLAYPIAQRSTGVYYSIEFQSEDGEIIKKLELALKRDERVIRHLIVKMNKFAIKYNDDKRKGLIGKKAEKEKSSSKEASENRK